jgi:site-specific DNA recombinase
MTESVPKPRRRASTPRPSRQVVRVAIYARYSSEMQSTTSADDQIAHARYCVEAGRIHSRRYPERKLVILEDWLIKDEAESGRSAGREGYQRILKGVSENAFDLVLVNDLSRMTRSLGHMVDLYDRLEFRKVECYSICDAISSADENSRQYFLFKGMVNDVANQSHASKTAAHMEARFLGGYSVGNLPYGYQSEPTRVEMHKGRESRTHFRINLHPRRAPVVLRVFELYRVGYGRNRIARMLNDDGIPAPGRSHFHDGPVGGWTSAHIENILSNEKYNGIWRWRMTSLIRNPDADKRQASPNDSKKIIEMLPEHAAALRITPKELWEQVSEIRAENARQRLAASTPARRAFGARLGRSGPDHLVSGIYKCSCGGNFVLVSGKDGGYYGCYAAHRLGKCTVRSLIARKRLEGALVETLKFLMRRSEWLEVLAERVNHWLQQARELGPRTRTSLEHNIRRLDGELRRIAEDVAKHGGSDTLSLLLREKEAQRRQLAVELRKTESVLGASVHVLPSSLKPRIATFVEALKANPMAVASELRELLPCGIPLEAPARRGGDWLARLELQGERLLYFEQHRIAVGAGLPPEPPDDPPEGGGPGAPGPPRLRSLPGGGSASSLTPGSAKFTNCVAGDATDTEPAWAASSWGDRPTGVEARPLPARRRGRIADASTWAALPTGRRCAQFRRNGAGLGDGDSLQRPRFPHH